MAAFNPGQKLDVYIVVDGIYQVDQGNLISAQISHSVDGIYQVDVSAIGKRMTVSSTDRAQDDSPTILPAPKEEKSQPDRKLLERRK